MRPFGAHFNRLMRRYSRPFVIKRPVGGRYDAGQYEAGEEEAAELVGVILSPEEQKRQGAGGSYSEGGYTLLTQRPLPKPLLGAKLEFLGHTYSIHKAQDYSPYGDVSVYSLRQVSQFD